MIERHTMTKVKKRTIEGYIERARSWIRLSYNHDMPLNCLDLAEDCLKEAEKILYGKR